MAAFPHPATSGIRSDAAIKVLQVGTPIGIAPTGTVAANGAVTLGTALSSTYLAGLYLYYPAGAAYAGSVAGFYWTVMSSTTVGTIFDNRASSVPTPPAANTAIVAAGPGAFTGDTTKRTALTATVPGKLLGRNGQLYLHYEFSYLNSAGTKTFELSFDGNVLHSSARTTSSHDTFATRWRNRGSETRGDGTVNTEATASGAGAIIAASIDTTTDRNIVVALQDNTVGTDFIILLSMQILAYPDYS
jgi:hypothetical protein